MDDFFKRVTSSRFYSFGDKLGDIMIASGWWVLCSLPIVTFIPSTIALYYTCNKSKSTELSMTKLFFKSFRSNFKQGFIINIIYII